MKLVSIRQFHAFALIAAVILYGGIIYKLFDTGWVINVTATTMLLTILFLSAVGLVLWNLIAQFFNSKKETKK